MIKWDDLNDTGNDHVLAVDDVTVEWTVPPAGTNTSVAFAAASSSVSEAAAPTDLTINVTNPDAVNATNVTITATGATGRISTFTTPVIAAGGATTGTCTVTLANNLLCDGNENVTFTITGVSGGQGTAFIGAQATHVLTVNNDDVCTSVQFVSTSSSVAETVSSTNLALTISDFDASNATSVTIAATGATGRITSFTTPVTFPANSGTNENVVVTIPDNIDCDGDAVVTFTITGISGGQGTPTIGANNSHALTITDNETSVSPTATEALPVGSSSFTANWDAISGATNYYLDVYTLSSTVSDDFTDGEFTSAQAWSGSTGSYAVLTDATVPNGAASTDGSFLACNASVNNTALTMSSTEVSEWRFSWASPTFAPSSANHFGVLLMSDAAVTTISQSFNGYYLRIGVDGAGDAIELWRSTGLTKTKIGDFPSSPVVAAAALTNGLNVRVTRSITGQFELFYSTGFTYASVPTNSAGTLTDNTHTASSFFGLYTNLANAAATRRNYIDNIVLGGSPTYLPGYNNFDAGTASSEEILGLDPGATYYYVVRAIGGCAAAGNSSEISVTTTEVDTYYSRATGDVNAAIWSDTPLGVAGPANWTAASNMVVQNGNVVTNTANVDVKNVTVETGGTLALNANTTFNVNGDEAIFDGTLTAADNSTLALVGADATILESTGGTLSLFDLTVNTPNGTLTDATIAMRGTLLLEDGDFDASLGSVTLLSTETATARLGPVGAGASYTGTTLTVQRYIPAGKTNWRFLGSPVTGNTIANWQDDFFTAGYPGSAYPIFLDPPVTGELWPSIRQYDETVTDADVNAGLIGVESQNTALAAGKGFAAWSGDNFVNTLAFTIDMSGAPRVANTPITLPMTWTDTGVPTSDGFNLVSNPVASPIDFELIDRGADVNNQYWIFDPAIGNNRVWTNGVGSGGANGIIQSSQGFWLKANGPAFATSVSEDDKVLAPTGGVFGGNEQPNLPMLRLFLTNDQNTFSDESIVVFDQGTPSYDVIDAQKLVFAHPQAPQLATRSAEGTDLSIDFYGAYTSAISIPVTVKAGVSGTYTLSAALSGITGLSCLSIEDLTTGSITPLVDGASYSFTLEAAAAPEARFILHGSAPVPFYAQDATCGAEANGQATVVVENGPMDITWTDAFGNVLLQQTNVEAGTATFAGLDAGSYIVRVSSNEACGELVTGFTIEQPFVLEAVTEELSMASCPNTTDGVLGMLVMGGVAPYTYQWSNGAQTEDLVAGAGDYSLTVTDANGCTWTSDLLTIEAGEGPTAGISAEATVLVNTPLSFTSTTDLAETWAWEFGDGATSTEANPTHTYTLAGTYTVTLTVSYGDCMDVTTFDVSVELSTSVSNVASAQPVRAWVNGDQFVVEHAFTGTVNVELLDATGRQHLQRASGAGAGRILLPAADLSTGIWFVRVTSAGEQHTLRVPLVR